MAQPNQLLFQPPDGQAYKDDDWKILCRSTPIPLDQFPSYLCGDDPSYIKPLLMCCWPVGATKLEELLRTRYPNCIVRAYNGFPKTKDDELYEDIPGSFPYMLTAIAKEFGIPLSKMEGEFMTWKILTPTGDVVLSLAIGNNRTNLMSLDIIQQIADTLFEGQMPQWYLCPYGWKWELKPIYERTYRRVMRVLS